MINNLRILVLLFSITSFVQCKSQNRLNKVNKLIIGAWAEKEDENVKFIITKNNFEYFDANYLYSYKLTDNNELVVLDSSMVVLKFEVLKVTKDSLLMKSKNDGNKDIIYKYYRRDKK
jgi:hypothetical protein